MPKAKSKRPIICENENVEFSHRIAKVDSPYTRSKAKSRGETLTGSAENLLAIAEGIANIPARVRVSSSKPRVSAYEAGSSTSSTPSSSSHAEILKEFKIPRKRNPWMLPASKPTPKTDKPSTSRVHLPDISAVQQSLDATVVYGRQFQSNQVDEIIKQAIQVFNEAKLLRKQARRLLQKQVPLHAKEANVILDQVELRITQLPPLLGEVARLLQLAQKYRLTSHK